MDIGNYILLSGNVFLLLNCICPDMLPQLVQH